MKTGELIILWIGGLLSVAVLLMGGIGGPLELRMYGIGLVVEKAVQTAKALISIWVLCGLIWLTVYKRKRNDR